MKTEDEGAETPETDQVEPKTVDPDVIRVRSVRKVVKVEVEDESGGVECYTLREMVGAERDKWLEAHNRRQKVNEHGVSVGIRDYKDIQADLISRCLYTERGTLVNVLAVSKWPASTQQVLFEACQKINVLTDKARDEEKKV